MTGSPGSRWLKKVSTRFRTPSIAVVTITVASWLLIALIYVLTKALGGDPFFIIAGVTGVSTVLLYWAYGLCIALGLWGDQAWRERADLEPRRHEPAVRGHLGRSGSS